MRSSVNDFRGKSSVIDAKIPSMPNYGIDKHIYIWYIEHMNMMLLDDLTAERISEDMPNCDALTALADYFDALSDTTRLKIQIGRASCRERV